jgi:hypothetical protein
MATDLRFACLMFEKNLETRRQIKKFENNDEIGQQYLWNWRVAQGLHGSYNDYLKKKPQATKCSDHRTINLIAHTAKIVTKLLR